MRLFFILLGACAGSLPDTGPVASGDPGWQVVSCEEPPDIVLSAGCEGGDAPEGECEQECSEVWPEAWEAWAAECGAVTEVCSRGCNKLYGEDECQIASPGRDSAELLAECLEGCGYAVAFPGDAGGYDPDTPYAGDEADKRIENRAQVELWAACVADRPCDDLPGDCRVEWFANPTYPCSH